MSGRGWGGFSCRLTWTLITAEAEPSTALASAEPRLRAHVGAGAAGGRCCSLDLCSWDATESPDLVGFTFKDCNLGAVPFAGQDLATGRGSSTAPSESADVLLFRSKTSTLLPELVPLHSCTGLVPAVSWGTCGSCPTSFATRLGLKGL